MRKNKGREGDVGWEKMNEARRKNQKRKRKSDDEGGPDNEGMKRGRKKEKIDKEMD